MVRDVASFAAATSRVRVRGDLPLLFLHPELHFPQNCLSRREPFPFRLCFPSHFPMFPFSHFSHFSHFSTPTRCRDFSGREVLALWRLSRTGGGLRVPGFRLRGTNFSQVDFREFASVEFWIQSDRALSQSDVGTIDRASETRARVTTGSAS